VNSRVLEVRDLSVEYATDNGAVRAVQEASFSLCGGEWFGLVGESGCGKTTLLLALLRMIQPPGRIVSGSILLEGTDLLCLSVEQMRRMRLASISLIPQGAMNSLNPVMRVGAQIALAMREHGEHLSGRELNRKVSELFSLVGLPAGAEQCYPHELSGGMKQRVCIAAAISLRPRLVLADEPTSALDVVVQRRVMQTLKALQQSFGMTVLLVGHDIGLMAQTTDRIGVMYAGRIVEIGATREVLSSPLHPYTRLLRASVPSLHQRWEPEGIPGSPPSLREPPEGCLFRWRCPKRTETCDTRTPVLRQVSEGRSVACWQRSRGI